VAHTKGYVQVVLRHEPAWMGCKLRVRVCETAKFYVRAEVLEVLTTAPDASVAHAVVAKASTKAPRTREKPSKATRTVETENGGEGHAPGPCEAPAPPTPALSVGHAAATGCADGCVADGGCGCGGTAASADVVADDKDTDEADGRGCCDVQTSTATPTTMPTAISDAGLQTRRTTLVVLGTVALVVALGRARGAWWRR
jgi:hypothetical protein